MAGESSLRAAAPAVAVSDISVRTDRLVLTVRLREDAPRETTPELAAALVRAVPSLTAHACVNEVGPTFAAVISHTSIPHALEHLIIDAQVRASAPAAPTFVGTTVWISRASGTARVEVSYTDDLVALAAVKEALALLNGLLA